MNENKNKTLLKNRMLHKCVCHPCAGACLSSLYHSNFSTCAAEVSTTLYTSVTKWLQPVSPFLHPKIMLGFQRLAYSKYQDKVLFLKILWAFY